MTETLAGDERYQIIKRVTLVGAIVNLLLAFAKVLIGIIGQSQALIADGIHSFSDLISDAVVLYTSKKGSQHADDDHPYGHERIETLGTVIVSILLFMAAAGITVDAADRIADLDSIKHPSWIALVAAIVSVLSKEALTQYTLAAAKSARSEILKANAWHHRSDAVSSVVVIIGIGGTMLGFEYLDAIAAIVVAMMIAKMSWDLGYGAIQELIDTGLDPDVTNRIHQLITSVDGVKALHMLRTRRMGANALVDVHILVDPTISVSEGHLIGDTVRESISREIDEINDITVHVDPEDDEINPRTKLPPLRQEIASKLKSAWQDIPEAKNVVDLTLHYLENRILAEVRLPLEAAQGSNDQVQALREKMLSAALKANVIDDLRVYFD